MKLRSKFVALALGLVGALVMGARAGHAEAKWDSVKKKIESAKDYTMTYEYQGPKGHFKFDYAFITEGPRIRTKVLRGSDKNVGSVIVYDAGRAKDKVVAKVGSGSLTRGLDHPDVKDTPFYQSMFGIILRDVKNGQLAGTKPGDSVRGAATTLFEFNCGANGSYKIWANESNDIVRTQKIQGGRVLEERNFSEIKWDSGPDVSL